jgi:hypothetical protein
MALKYPYLLTESVVGKLRECTKIYIFIYEGDGNLPIPCL